MFKVGDRVKAIKAVDCLRGLIGQLGTVVIIYDRDSNPIGVDFDDWTEGHDCGGTARSGHGRCGKPDEFELIKGKQIRKKYTHIVLWDIGGSDPFRLFFDKPNAINFIKELSEDKNNREIRIVEIKSIQKATVKKSIRFEKM